MSTFISLKQFLTTDRCLCLYRDMV